MGVFEGLASLLDKSLLQQTQPSTGEVRLEMLETIRAYAAEQLRLSGEEEAVLQAQAAYCVVLAEDGAKELVRPSQCTDWLARFDLEHANFRKALEWLIEAGTAEWGMRLGVALLRFWEVREYLAEAQIYLMQLLQLPAAQVRTKLRATALFAFCSVKGVDDHQIALKGESLEIYRELHDQHGVLVMLNALGAANCELGDYDSARARFEESLAVAKELDDTAAVAHCLSNVATAMKLAGATSLARSKYRASMDLFYQLGDRNGVAASLNRLGDLALQEGDYARAESLYAESVALFREIDDQWGIANSLQNLGNLARDRADYAQAELLYKESLKLFRALRRTLSIAQVLESFARSAAQECRPRCALTLAGAADALRRTISTPLPRHESAILDASLEQARHDIGYGAAAACWKEGWEMRPESAVDYALAL
jgi:tetratricopeptide (TPR) repeat protein